MKASPIADATFSILIVDDDQDFGLSLLDILESQAYTVNYCDDASSALAWLESHSCQLALLDIRLGKTNGVQLMEEIRARWPVECIVMTAYAILDTAIEAIRRGAYDYLRKPILHDDLFNRVQRCQEKIRLAREKERVQEQLARQQERYYDLFHFSPDAYLTAEGSEWLITEINRTAETLFAVSSDQMLGTSLLDWVIPPDAWKLRELFWAPGLLHRWNDLEVGIRQTNREPLVCSCSISLDRQAHPVRLRVLFRDITERKKAALELLEAKNAAEAASRTRENFLAVMSHELRTPLNPIIGFSDLMLHLHPDPQCREWLAIILHSGRSMLEMIEQILDFIRIENGKLASQPEIFDLGQIVEFCISSVDCRTNRNRLEVVWAGDLSNRIQQEGLLLEGDPWKIRQILLNLINNACKFTQDGEIVLTIQATNQENSPVWFSFAVRDTGIGIPSERLQDIFLPFTQIDSTNTRKYGGIGLGLSIVKELTRLLDGRIRVESTPGYGSTFTVDLPLQPVPHLAVASAAPVDSCFPEVRVLYVEEAGESRQLAHALLQSFRCQITLADNGRDALDWLQKQSFMLIFLDVCASPNDGIALAASIRQLDSPNRESPVVAVTAMADETARQQFRQCGFVDLFPKPFQREHLRQILQQHCGPSRTA